MFKVLKNELIKMVNSRKFYVLSSILIGSIILMALMKDNNINAQNFVFETFAGNIMKPILPSFMIIIIAEAITEDYVHGTLKFSLMTPVKRSGFIIGKLLFIYLYSLILLALSFLTSYIVCAVTFGPAMKAGFMKYFIFNIKCYASIILPIFSFCTLISFIALFMGSSGETIGLGLGIQFMTIIIEHSIKNAVYFLPGAGMYMYDFVRSSGELNNISIPSISICACIYTAVLMCLSIIDFKNKDLVL